MTFPIKPAAIILLAAASPAQSQSIPQPAVFAQTMAEVNRLAIATAEMALTRAKTEGARDYARRAIKEHTSMQQELENAAKADGVTLRKGLNPDLQRKRDALAHANESQFDAAYLSNEIIVQQAARDAAANYSEQGPGGGLKTYAVNYRNTYLMHLVRAKSLTNPE